MPIFGRKPGSLDGGWGYIYGGSSRGSIMGKPGSNGWAYRAAGRMGYNTGSGTNMQIAVYSVSGSSIASRLALTSTFYVNTYMADRASGADHGANLTAPLQIFANTNYALALGAHGSARNVFGQDMSGHPMHDKDGSILPVTYAANRVAPEGKMSLWLEYEANVKPDTPSGFAPAHNSIITSSQPTLAVNFRDANEAVPGFSVGQADKLKKYRFQVLNSAQTSVLRDSGIVNASSAQQTARRASWTVPTALPAGRYVARATVYDMFDTPSTTASWAFTINAGGAMVDVDVAQNAYEPHWADASRRLLGQTTTVIGGTWTHSDNLNANAIQLVLHDENGVIVGAVSDVFSVTLAPNEWVGRWTTLAGMNMPELERGRMYRVGMRARDTTGLWSSWSYSSMFTVNSFPDIPTSLQPGPNAVTSVRPELSAIMTDSTDSSASLDSGFYIRKQGDTGNGIFVPGERRWFANGRHYAQPDHNEMPDHDVYEWRCRASDPHGLVGDWSSWQKVTYALAPELTITEPDGTIDVGTPQVIFTSDKSLTKFTVTIREDGGGVVHESGEITVSGPGGDYLVPAGVLRNETGYTIEVIGTDTVGLTGSATTSIYVSYTAPEALDWITVEKTPGPYEYQHVPDEWSRIAISWAQALPEIVSDEDFAGYLLERENTATGERKIVAHFLTRGETVFIDKTVASRVSYRYRLRYLMVVNGIDIVESEVVEGTGSVSLMHTTITSMDADDLGAPLRYWKKRKPKWVTDVEIVPSWGPEPIGFMGTSDSLKIDGDFAVLDAEDGSFTALEIIRDVRAMATPIRTGERSIAPRQIFYRDPRGRAFFAMIRDGDEDDEHREDIGRMSLTITQIAGEEGAL
ncbi:hypothetical protein [Microbacterium sp.]|uniref:hypothetical protein n=1 Tax=Microbacterium sp. TaxID=51671 RepID=UPI00261E6915|nr:hypothetical protein [Microbacterium sp.]